MVEPGGRARLALRAVVVGLPRHGLYRHLALEALVPRLPDHSKAAGAQAALEAVAVHQQALGLGRGHASRRSRERRRLLARIRQRPRMRRGFGLWASHSNLTFVPRTLLPAHVTTGAAAILAARRALRAASSYVLSRRTGGARPPSQTQLGTWRGPPDPHGQA